MAGSGDAGYTNVGEEGNDISDTDPDCSVARPFYPSNRSAKAVLEQQSYITCFVLLFCLSVLTAVSSAYVVSVSSTYFSTRNTPYCMSAQAAASSSGFVIPPCTLLRFAPLCPSIPRHTAYLRDMTFVAGRYPAPTSSSPITPPAVASQISDRGRSYG